MNADKLLEEITQTKAKLSLLEAYLLDIQENCTHVFEGTPYFEICVKCRKSNALYY